VGRGWAGAIGARDEGPEEMPDAAPGVPAAHQRGQVWCGGEAADERPVGPVAGPVVERAVDQRGADQRPDLARHQRLVVESLADRARRQVAGVESVADAEAPEKVLEAGSLAGHDRTRDRLPEGADQAAETGGVF